jgi:hypothetical protein
MSETGPTLQQPPAVPNAAALALLDAWYATPDDRPSGYWDELEAWLKAHRLAFGTCSLPTSPVVGACEASNCLLPPASV